jgi:hypothetical protein
MVKRSRLIWLLALTAWKICERDFDHRQNFWLLTVTLTVWPVKVKSWLRQLPNYNYNYNRLKYSLNSGKTRSSLNLSFQLRDFLSISPMANQKNRIKVYIRSNCSLFTSTQTEEFSLFYYLQPVYLKKIDNWFHILYSKLWVRNKEKGATNFWILITYSDSSWPVDNGYIGLRARGLMVTWSPHWKHCNFEN